MSMTKLYKEINSKSEKKGSSPLKCTQPVTDSVVDSTIVLKLKLFHLQEQNVLQHFDSLLRKDGVSKNNNRLCFQ